MKTKLIKWIKNPNNYKPLTFGFVSGVLYTIVGFNIRDWEFWLLCIVMAFVHAFTQTKY